MTRTLIWPLCASDLGDMSVGQGHNKPLDHGRPLREISASNMTVRSYGPDTDFPYTCIATLILAIWLWVKRMLGSWTTIVWNIIQIQYQRSQLWPGKGLSQAMCVVWPWPWRYDLWIFGSGVLKRKTSYLLSRMTKASIPIEHKVTTQKCHLKVWSQNNHRTN